jgi:hypothetical protein
MTGQQLRWLLLALASGLVTFVVIRRRQQIAAALPQPIVEHAERIVIPWTTLERRTASEAEPTQTADDDEGESSESMRRKVSAGARISFGGKRYGPLPESLVGEYVDVETRDGKLFLLHNGTPVANFALQS